LKRRDDERVPIPRKLQSCNVEVTSFHPVILAFGARKSEVTQGFQLELTMEPIKTEDRIVHNIHRDGFKPFTVDGAPLPGQWFMQLDTTFPEVTGFHIYRMDAGTSSQPHRHTCHEQFYVIDGELEDHDGTIYRPGDMVLLKEGTVHSSSTKTGATLAVFIRTVEMNL
jgi:mannose-6-phosphate isomerase-like protein (cupin superfamily)